MSRSEVMLQKFRKAKWQTKLVGAGDKGNLQPEQPTDEVFSVRRAHRSPHRCIRYLLQHYAYHLRTSRWALRSGTQSLLVYLGDAYSK